MMQLPIERVCLIESTPCVKCGGRGKRLGARDVEGRSSDCWTCKGLGWRPTPAGKDLYYDVLALLGISVTRWPTRIDPFLVRGRRFTAEQLASVDALMMSRVGKGAVLGKR